MQSSAFWDITLYIPLKANRSFGGTCRLHCYLVLADFLLGLFLDHEDGCDVLLLTSRRYIFTPMNCVPALNADWSASAADVLMPSLQPLEF
jgi:hypothetical protein